MSDNTNSTLGELIDLGLSKEEAIVYIEVLRSPKTHLRLSHLTGINRTKVYRLVEELEKKSLIARRTDDRGTYIMATDPTSLEVGLIASEEQIRHKRQAFAAVLPGLQALRETADSDFMIRSYEGPEGLKQMLWHELKADKEILILGSGTTEELMADHRWAERHRQLNVQAGYKIRELMNYGEDHKSVDFTEHGDFMSLYQCRRLPRTELILDNQVSIYNDTVATYYWRQDHKAGIEIVNKSYAEMMRQIFEKYWSQAKSDTSIDK